MWKITVTPVHARSAHALMSGFVPIGEADDTLPGRLRLGGAAGYRVWFLDIGSLLGNKASVQHHKLNSSGRLLLIMWACASPCWCGCCNLALPDMLFAEQELDDALPCLSLQAPLLCVMCSRRVWPGTISVLLCSLTEYITICLGVPCCCPHASPFLTHLPPFISYQN